MIIFYDKQTGLITGTIGGRVNSPQEKEMCVGDQSKTEKIIVEWSPTGKEYDSEINEEQFTQVGVNEQNQPILKREIIKKSVKRRENEPQTDQKDLFILFDKHSIEVYKYKIDINTKKFILK